MSNDLVKLYELIKGLPEKDARQWLLANLTNSSLRKQTKSGTEIIVDNYLKIPDQVWDPKVSKTIIKSLVDRNHLKTRTITAGYAQIFDNLLKHQHAATEIYYVTKGHAKMHLGDKIYNLEPEKIIYLPSGIPHYTEIVGDEPLEYLYIFAKDSLDDVEYVFDNSVKISSSQPSVQKVDQELHNKSKTSSHTLVHETEPHEQGLHMDHIQIPKNNSFKTKNKFPALIYIRSGLGKLYIDDEELDLLEGSYAYVPEEIAYLIENESANHLSILSFHSLPPTS